MEYRRLKAIAKFKKKIVDYCTWFPDGDYGDCCKNHDKDYENPDKNKFISDIDVVKCVWSRGKKVRAILMGAGLFPFGWIWRNKAVRGAWYRFY